MKKIMLILVIFILGSTTTVLTTSTNEKQVLNLQENNLDSPSIISEVLTFDELTEIVAKDNNISKPEAVNEIIENYAKDNVGINSLSINNLKALVASNTYRTISSTVNVTSKYKPTLRFYCETSESSTAWEILKILYVGMNREYNGITKQFGGTIYTNLENSGSIFWIFNGDFYDNGTTDSEIQIDLGEGATINFNVSYPSNHYTYYYEENIYNIR